MLDKIISNQKLKHKLRNQKNKRISSLFNHNYYHLPLFNLNNSNNFKNNNQNNSLIVQEISRNKNNHLGALILKNEAKKKINSFFNLTLSKRQNYNIHKILEHTIKPYALSNKTIVNTIKNDKEIYGYNCIKRKSDLIIKHYFDEKEKVFPWKNPFKDYKDPLLIYQILKFNKNDDEKYQKKSPLDQAKYNKYMEQVNKIKHNKNNSSSVRRKYIELLINKSEKEGILRNIKNIKKEEKRRLYEVELKDTVETPSIQAQKIKKMIYKFLTKESNIKEIINNENFYKSLENRVNFIFDGLKLPTIKNKFINKYIGQKKDWSNINAINSKTLLMLNQLRLIIQKKKDKKSQLKTYKKEGSFVIDENNNIHFKYDNEDNNFNNLDKEYLYECQKFFVAKTISYKDINITNNILIKNCIFNKYKYIFGKKKTKIII